MPTRALIQDVSTGDVIYPFSGSNIQNESIPNSALQTDVTLQGNTFNDANELVQLESDGKLPALDGSNLTGVISTPTGAAGGALDGFFPNPTIPRLPTANDSGVTKSVWLSIRTDGQTGTGTKADPFDVSTRTKFDGLMSSLGTYTDINLFPGTYLTAGWGNEQNAVGGGGNPDGSNGFVLKEGQRIIGSGMDETIIKLDYLYPSDGFSIKRFHVVSAPRLHVDNVEIKDLTVDGNAPTLGVNTGSAYKDYAVEAVYLTGANCRVERVHAINGYGFTDSGSGTEAWQINIGDAVDTSGTDLIACEISSCRVTNQTGDWSNGVCFQATAGNPHNVSGTIHDNYCDSTVCFGANLSGTNKVVIYSNTFVGVVTGVHADTDDNTNIVVVGNTISATGQCVGMNPATANTFDNWNIVGNNFTTTANSASAIAFVDGGATGPFSNFSIQNNTHTHTGASVSFFSLATNKFHNVWVQGNISDAPLSVSGLHSSVKIGNNYLSTAYTPDANVPLLNASNVFTAQQTVNVTAGTDAIQTNQGGLITQGISTNGYVYQRWFGGGTQFGSIGIENGGSDARANSMFVGSENTRPFWLTYNGDIVAGIPSVGLFATYNNTSLLFGSGNQLDITGSSSPVTAGRPWMRTDGGGNFVLNPGGSGTLYIGVDNPGSGINLSGPIGLNTVGATISVKSGSNAKAGTFTLSSGAATVANTSVTANSVILVTVKTVSGTRVGNPDIVPTASTGFVATGAATDNSTYNYVILEVN